MIVYVSIDHRKHPLSISGLLFFVMAVGNLFTMCVPIIVIYLEVVV